jgi:hypothetical protein
MPGDNAIMHIFAIDPARAKRAKTRLFIPRRGWCALALVVLLVQPGCLFRIFHKKKPPAAPAIPAPVRVALLPLNIPQGDTELTWFSFATTAVIADVALAAPDVELVPIWESIPAALQSLGNSRTVTTDIAELVATRLSARWATEGDIIKSAKGLTVRVDFIPSRPNLVPFRYEKAFEPEELPDRFQEAMDQFLRYLIVRPLDLEKLEPMDPKMLREIAGALDAEYGWFGPAKPGSSGKVVEELARTRPALAKLLFSPTLYPILAK